MQSQDRKVSGSNYFQISLVQNLVTSCTFFAISVSIHARHLIPTSSKLFIGQWLKAVRTVQLTDTTTSLHESLAFCCSKCDNKKKNLVAHSSVKSFKWIHLPFLNVLEIAQQYLIIIMMQMLRDDSDLIGEPVPESGTASF